MIDLRSFRFLIPPFILGFTIFLAMFFDPDCNLNNIQSLFPSFWAQLDKFGAVLIGSVILFFAFGFVISTIGISIIRLYSLVRKKYTFSKLKKIHNRLDIKGKWNGTAVNWEWDPKATGILQQLFDLEDWRQDGEFCEQAVLSKVKDPLRDHVQRKWEFFQTNLNSFVAILIGILLFELLLKIDPRGWGYLVIILFLCSIAFNGYGSWKDAMRFDHFLVRNSDKLKKCETKSDREMRQAVGK
ncbi:MAG: hypothetical protein ACFFCW_30180 [Candidatus Hodarchaeota archaeon]